MDVLLKGCAKPVNGAEMFPVVQLTCTVVESKLVGTARVAVVCVPFARLPTGIVSTTVVVCATMLSYSILSLNRIMVISENAVPLHVHEDVALDVSAVDSFLETNTLERRRIILFPGVHIEDFLALTEKYYSFIWRYLHRKLR
jgi:hypothetical protein